MKIMLCGASDTSDVKDEFFKVTKQLGGEPLTYLTGNILYENKVGADFKINSAETVREADLCVFVIIGRYGEITWETELEHALSEGKPFIILCLTRTWGEYLTLSKSVDIEAIPDDSQRNMVRILQQLDSHRQLSVVSFTMNKFGEVYRHEAAKEFKRGLGTLAERRRREQLHILMHDRSRMTSHDLQRAEELAVDEFEEKGRRKVAIEALAERGGASPNTILDLIASGEQGVQRLAMYHLATLYRQRPPDPTFLDECVAAANNSDDTGIARRLIPALFELDPCGAINAAMRLKFTDIGVRHRLADLLVDNEHLLKEASLRSNGVELLSRCVGAGDKVDWQQRAKDCLKRLQDGSNSGDG